MLWLDMTPCRAVTLIVIYVSLSSVFRNARVVRRNFCHLNPFINVQSLGDGGSKYAPTPSQEA